MALFSKFTKRATTNLVEEFTSKVNSVEEFGTGLVKGPKFWHDPKFPFTPAEHQSFTEAWSTLTERFPHMPQYIQRVKLGGDPLVHDLLPGAAGLTMAGPGWWNEELMFRMTDKEDARSVNSLSKSAIGLSLPTLRTDPVLAKAETLRVAKEQQANLPPWAKKYKGQLLKNMEDNRWLVDPSAGGVFTHEFGHSLFMAGAGNEAKKLGISVQASHNNMIMAMTNHKLADRGMSYEKLIQMDPEDVMEFGFKNNDLMTSLYGATSPFEDFAESFTDVIRNPNPAVNSLLTMEGWNKEVSPEFRVSQDSGLRHKKRLQEGIQTKQMFGF